MLFVTEGDDVSLPQRCERVMQTWVDGGRRLDLIASALTDIDADGNPHGTVLPSDLATYHNAADWAARPPFVVGAAQAWTRRVFEQFGPLPQGVVGEDLIMAFRAIVSGGALTLAEPLVAYRRGGVSRRVRNLRAQDVVRRLLASNRAALVELPQLLADAERAGQAAAVREPLGQRLRREEFVRRLFDAPSMSAKVRVLLGARDVDIALKLRLGLYALSPEILAPFFFAKRLLSRGR